MGGIDKIDLDGLMGIWFLPRIDKSQINGLLCIENDVIVLKTTEQFVGIEDLQVETYSAIVGFTSNGKRITLLNCAKPSQKVNMPGMIEFIYRPDTIVVGKQLSEESELVLVNISAHYFGLEKWLDERPFTINQNSQGREISLNYKMSSSHICHLEGITVYTENTCHCNCEIYDTFNLCQSTTFKIEFDDVQSWNRSLNELYDLGSFLTLCMGCVSKIDSVQGTMSDGTKIEIIQNFPSDSDPKLKASFFIDFRDISNNFEDCLRIWWNKKDEISPVIGYFIEAHSSSVNIVSGFLKMVQALESYSRKLRKSNLIPQEEHAKRITRLTAAIGNEQDKKWLEDVLATPILNEPSCQQRIKALFIEVAKFLGISSKQLKSLSYKIVNTRNYYTHFNDSLKKDLLSDDKMFYSITLMKFVLRSLLMKELGLDDSYISMKLDEDTELAIAKGELGVAPKFVPIKVIKKKSSEPVDTKNNN